MPCSLSVACLLEIQGFLRIKLCGRKFTSPLSLLFDSWSDQQSSPVKLNVWLEDFDRRVEVVRDSLRDKLDLVRVKNEEIQRKKLLRTFEVGDQVLLGLVAYQTSLHMLGRGHIL